MFIVHKHEKLLCVRNIQHCTIVKTRILFRDLQNKTVHDALTRLTLVYALTRLYQFHTNTNTIVGMLISV